MHLAVEPSPTLQPKDSTLHFRQDSILHYYPSVVMYNLESCSIYTIPWSMDHGYISKVTLHYKNEGRQPYDSFTIFALYTNKTWSLYIEFDQNLGFKPQNLPWGTPHPISPEHKHRESPSSHFDGVEIFLQRPPNSI